MYLFALLPDRYLPDGRSLYNHHTYETNEEILLRSDPGPAPEMDTTTNISHARRLSRREKKDRPAYGRRPLPSSIIRRLKRTQRVDHHSARPRDTTRQSHHLSSRHHQPSSSRHSSEYCHRSFGHGAG